MRVYLCDLELRVGEEITILLVKLLILVLHPNYLLV